MADSEKLTALKKAYADIILNTAKEAAARVVVSERKALRYQQELFAAKDEALRMLVRLKQMLDAKVNEAEMTSFNQQRRIEELEAQLGEAEDIVRDLRVELREVQEELEKVTTKQIELLDEQVLKNDVATHATASMENILNTSGPGRSSLPEAQHALVSISDLANNPMHLLDEPISDEDRCNNFGSVISSLPGEHPELASVSDVKSSTLNRTHGGSKCYNGNGSHKDNCFAFNPDFASIVMRNKNPELYRNGCTQRIRAFERILLDGNLSLSVETDDAKSENSRGKEDNKAMCMQLTPKAANKCREEKNSNELKVVQLVSDCIVNSFDAKMKRLGRCRKSKASSFRKSVDQVIETCQAPELSCPEMFSVAVDEDAQCRESFRTTEKRNQKDPASPLGPNLSSEAIGSAEVAKSDGSFLRTCYVQNMTNNDQVLISNSQLMREENKLSSNSEILASKTDLETEKLYLKTSELTEGLSSQPVDNRFLKYTFQRKRKRESFSSPDRDCSVDISAPKQQTQENENSSLELQKSDLITESSASVYLLSSRS